MFLKWFIHVFYFFIEVIENLQKFVLPLTWLPPGRRLLLPLGIGMGGLHLGLFSDPQCPPNYVFQPTTNFLEMVFSSSLALVLWCVYASLEGGRWAYVIYHKLTWVYVIQRRLTRVDVIQRYTCPNLQYSHNIMESFLVFRKRNNSTRTFR